MTAVELIVKRCSKCGESKSLSDFYRNRSRRDGLASLCKQCGLSKTKANQAKKRAEIGDDAWLAHQASIMRRYRDKPDGRAKARHHSAVRTEALRRLVEAHSDEYQRLLTLARVDLGLPVNRWEREA